MRVTGRGTSLLVKNANVAGIIAAVPTTLVSIAPLRQTGRTDADINLPDLFPTVRALATDRWREPIQVVPGLVYIN